MCDVPSTSGGGGKGAVVVLLVGAGSVVAYLATPATAKPAPVQAAPAASPGFPWLTASLAVVAGAALALLVVVAVRALRRRRRATVRVVPSVMRRPVPQRAIGPAPINAKDWLDGRIDAR